MARRDIQDMCRRHGIRPVHTLGQNFIVSPSVVQLAIHHADLSPRDTVVEVGAGLGTLTRELARHAKKVIAVEKDRAFEPALKEQVGECENVQIIFDDILEVELPRAPFKVVANIPYYLTAHLIRRLLEAPHPPEKMVLMVQKEVAERMKAAPPRMNLLAVSVQLYAEVKIIAKIARHNFWPQPTIDSALIVLTAHNEPYSPAFRKRFFQLVRGGFAQPRKQLVNNLSVALEWGKEDTAQWLREHGVNPRSRPGELSVEEWKTLA